MSGWLMLTAILLLIPTTLLWFCFSIQGSVWTSYLEALNLLLVSGSISLLIADLWTSK